MYLSRKQSKLLAAALVFGFIVAGGTLLWQKPAPIPQQEQEVSPTQRDFSERDSSTVDTHPLSDSGATTTPSPSLPVSAQENATQGDDEAFSLQKFERSETVDGKVLWRILGENARYLPEQNTVEIQNCNLTFTTDEDERVQISSQNATISLDGATIGRALLEGSVTLDYENSKVVIESDQAIFHQQARLVTVEGPVAITSQWYEVTGNGLTANLARKEFRIAEQVESVIKPQAGRAEL